MMRHCRPALLFAATLTTLACSGSGTATSPTTTTPASTTELFAGTLSPGGETFYSFAVISPGTVAVTLASTATNRIGPAVPVLLTVSLGTPSGFGCAAASAVATAPALAAQLSLTSATTGIYCVNVGDPGGLTTDITFVIRIVHT